MYSILAFHWSFVLYNVIFYLALFAALKKGYFQILEAGVIILPILERMYYEFLFDQIKSIRTIKAYKVLKMV